MLICEGNSTVGTAHFSMGGYHFLSVTQRVLKDIVVTRGSTAFPFPDCYRAAVMRPSLWYHQHSMSLPWFTCLFLIMGGFSFLKALGLRVCLCRVYRVSLLKALVLSLLLTDCLYLDSTSLRCKYMSQTLRSDMWLILTKRGDYFWKLFCVKQQLADGTQRFFKGAQLALCHCLLGFFPMLSILTEGKKPTQAAGIINQSPGVQPWLI